MKKHLIFKLSVFLVILVFATTAQAQAEQPIRAEISLGFDDQCKYGNWLPIYIELDNPGDDFSGQLGISYSQAVHKFPVELATNGQKSFSTELYLDVRNVSQEIVFSLYPADPKADEIILQRIPLNCSATRLVGVLTNTPAAFTILNALQPANTTDIAFLSAHTIPEHWLGLQAIDILILANTNATQLRDEQRSAINTWVQQGGQIIFGGGAEWQHTLAGFDDLLPMELSGARTADISLKIDSASEIFLLEKIILLTGTLNDDAKVLVQDGNTPLVAQQRMGAGTSTLLTFDPNITMLRAWDDLLNFYDHILISSPEKEDFAGVRNWNALIDATSRFTGLKLPSTWLVFGLLFIYVISVGPAQYLILKRLRKLELSWVTIPAITLVFTVGLILLGWDLRGSKPRINQLAVVHHWAGEKEASLGGYASIFAPKRDIYQIAVDGDFTPQPFAPHHYYNTPNNEWIFTLHNDSFLAETNVDNAEIMPLALRGSLPSPEIEIDLRLNLNQRNTVLAGTIINHGKFDLDDSVLIYPWGYRNLGRINAGEEVEIELPANILTNSSTNNAAIYLDDLIATSIYSDHQGYKEYHLLRAVFEEHQMPPVGFMLLGWDKNQVPYALTLVDHEVDNEALTAYLISFDVEITTEEERFTIPPVFFNWSIPEDNKFSYNRPDDLRFAYQDSAEIHYQLSTSITYSNVNELILHLDGDSSQRNDFPLEIFLWNFETEEWEQQEVINWGNSLITNASPYVSETASEIRIMLNENSNGGGTFTVTSADFSLVVEP
jgi:hypothetical protein